MCYNFFMETKILKYNVIIRKEGKYFVAYVPTLGISDFGKTIEQTRTNVKSAIECHVEGLIKTKSEIPCPDNQDFFISQTEISVPKSVNLAF